MNQAKNSQRSTEARLENPHAATLRCLDQGYMGKCALNYPLKIVSPRVLQSETVRLHKSLSWHLHCNHKQHLQRARPRKKNYVFLKAWRLAQRVLHNWRQWRAGWRQQQGPLLVQGLMCSSGPSRAESHCETAQLWLKHHLKAACLGPRTLLKGGPMFLIRWRKT